MVDAIIREWLRRVLMSDAARLGYGEAVQLFLAIFHANDAYRGLVPHVIVGGVQYPN